LIAKKPPVGGFLGDWIEDFMADGGKPDPKEYYFGVDTISKNLILGKKGLKILGYENDAHVPDEVKAVIYHEIAHFKHNDLQKGVIAKISPYAGVAVGLLAMRMIERYQEKKQNRTEQNRKYRLIYHLRKRKSG
jgi:hypothetical protein